MDEQTFRGELEREGYPEVVFKSWDPGAVAPPHRHPFTARALITRGQLTLTLAGETRVYLPGDIFFIPAGTEHSEVYGPEGATYLVGRR